MKKPAIIILSIVIFITLNGCSKTDNIKDWLKEGTKDYQEKEKEIRKSDKSNLKTFLSKNGCINGSSAKIIQTKDEDYILYEVTCVTKSKKFVVKCGKSNCSK